MNLPPVALSALRAREFVRQSLQFFGLRDGWLADRLTLMASELVTNAILHAHTDMELRLSAEPAAIVLAVSDGHPLGNYPTCTPPLATSGRGLILVDALADSWGMTGIDGGRGKTVWARVCAA